MSNLGNANSPVPVSPPTLRTWDFMETAFVSLIAYGVYTLTSGLVLTIMLAMHDGANTSSAAQFQAYGAGYIVASPLTIAVLWIAIRMARRDFAEYLALNWPSSGELLRALAITAILLLAESLVLSFVGAGEAPPDPYVSGEHADGFLILLIGGCIAAPVMEEFVLRGFMFRGWSQSFLGPVGSIVLTSVLWGMIHTQYDWFGRFWIFVTGLALGHFRWRSNSTWLTVMVHSAINILLLFMIGLQL
ncbi:MAG TPA: type II CAAX endopeptidase family protein [Bradyrhizobium sp.]|jgi:membrane protease YdiL (CAAX protease family)|nr:type II CAAX endopeptidase family protein [Bradyrhizobium sp.]